MFTSSYADRQTSLPIGKLFASPGEEHAEKNSYSDNNGVEVWYPSIDIIHAMKVCFRIRKSEGADGTKSVLYKRLPECYDYFLS